MSRNAFFLGFLATGSQVLLLRELISSLNGSELFIGTALFGWLIWVALGAFVGGRERMYPTAGQLFVTGMCVLPITIVCARLSPLAVTSIPGELIPFSVAALISIGIVLPSGLACGWLFPVIARDSRAAGNAVVTVYLWEGVGAFAAGLLTAFLIGVYVSSLGMSFAIAATVLIGVFGARSNGAVRRVAVATLALAVGVAGVAVAPSLAREVDALKYRAYHVVTTFDTHYGRETILSRDSTILLLTDNTIEANSPDLESAENQFVPPMVYRPDARHILYVGRPEFGVARLAERFPSVTITSVDPRESLDNPLDSIFGSFSNVIREETDPVRFCRNPRGTRQYDIVILAPRELNSYQTSRLITNEFMRSVKGMMSKGGVLFVPTLYDSDRYVTEEVARLLATIHSVLSSSFLHVAAWPGTTTLFFASDDATLDVATDSILARLRRMPYQAQYISEDYLYDRLNPLKLERLQSVFSRAVRSNSLDYPILPFYQTSYAAKAHGFDRSLFGSISTHVGWFWLFAAAIVAFAVGCAAIDRRRNSFSLFLYFVAGAASLSLELIAFYLYQTSAGSLYTELAALIGAFMLGLAVGTYLTHRLATAGAEIMALVLLLVSSSIFLMTFRRVSPGILLPYYGLFLFTIAIGTGSLFVGATLRYFRTWPRHNRGVGYAWELIGSSLGAILPTTILLPLIGLNWLLTAITAILVLALAGSIVTARTK
jgi:spermidine synthase